MLRLRPLIPFQLPLPSSAFHDARRRTKARYFPCQLRHHLWSQRQTLPSLLEPPQAAVPLIRRGVNLPTARPLPQPYVVECLQAMKILGFLQSFHHPLMHLDPLEETRLPLHRQVEVRQPTQCRLIGEAGLQRKILYSRTLKTNVLPHHPYPIPGGLQHRRLDEQVLEQSSTSLA